MGDDRSITMRSCALFLAFVATCSGFSLTPAVRPRSAVALGGLRMCEAPKEAEPEAAAAPVEFAASPVEVAPAATTQKQGPGDFFETLKDPTNYSVTLSVFVLYIISKIMAASGLFENIFGDASG